MPSFKKPVIYDSIYVYKYYIIILVYQDINIIFPWKEFIYVQNKDEPRITTRFKICLAIWH